MRLKGGVSLISRPPAFSTDAKLLLLCTGSTVSIFSVATGLPVNELEGHTGPVTSVNVVEYGGVTTSIINHVWTSSLDGTVRFWNFSTGSLIKTVNVGRPIFSMVIPRLSEPESSVAYKQCICLLLVQWNKDTDIGHQDKKLNKTNNKGKGLKGHLAGETSFRVVLHNLTTEKPCLGHLAAISSPQLLVRSQLGGLVGIVDNRKIRVWRVSKEGFKGLKSFQVTVLHHTRALQAVAFDPTESLVAGSDSSGRILVWKNVGERKYGSPMQGKGEDAERRRKSEVDLDSNSGVRGNDDAAALSTYHWHADQVNFLMFSLDGAYLFSGGKEAVFVMWQLETGKRKFLPHLGSSLLHCACSSDASIFSIVCADNSIKVVNIGTMAVQKCIQGIKPLVSLPRKVKLFDLRMVAFLPGARNLVLPAQDLSLQFYDVLHDRQVEEVQVTPHNYVSSKDKQKDGSERQQTSEPPVFITHVVFSKDGSLMATAECHMGELGIGRGSRLKFWKRTSVKADFCLTTQIDDPHGSHVSSLVFHPILNLAVSCSSAGEFKVWVCDESRPNVPSSGWRCRSVGSYRQKRMFCADFSSDGTLLAVAAEELITLWNPSSNGLVHVLARSSVDPIKTLRFVPSTQYLVVATRGGQPELTVWNLETLSICWSYHVAVEAIAVDPNGPYFATVGVAEKVVKKKGKKGTARTFITIFDAHNPAPYAIWNAQDVEESTVFWLPSLELGVDASTDSEKGDSEKTHLVFLNHQREYTVFDPLAQEDKSETASKKSFSRVKKEGPSAFASVYGKAVNPQLEFQSDVLQSIGGQPQGKLLNCPSHLISLKSIGLSYIESLLERRTGVAQ